jgi:thiol-disulfide isomerase/thioredoxin
MSDTAPVSPPTAPEGPAQPETKAKPVRNRTDRILSILLVVLSLVGIAGLGFEALYEEPLSDHARDLLKPGTQAPGFRVRTAQGPMVTEQDTKGQVLVFDFWATWCVPCQAEAPILTDLAKEYGGKGVTFFAVNRDENDPVGASASFVQSRHLEGYPVVFGDDELVVSYEVRYLPTIYVVGKDGKVRFANTGATSAKRLRREIEAALHSGG